MASVRLPEKLESRLRAVTSRAGVTRSHWIRRAIEKSLESERTQTPHEIYLELLGDEKPVGSGRGDLASNHSAILKQMLREKHRR